jgi:hypothetical protein
MFSGDLQQAIALAKSGQHDEARSILQRIIKANPHDDLAWLWYADTLPTREERVQALKWCLKFNPNRTLAQKGIGKLQNSARHEVQADQGHEKSNNLFADQKHAQQRNDQYSSSRELLFSAFFRPTWENKDFYWLWDAIYFCEGCGESLTQCKACEGYFCIECQMGRCNFCGELVFIEAEGNEFPRSGFTVHKIVPVRGLEGGEEEYDEEDDEDYPEVEDDEEDREEYFAS